MCYAGKYMGECGEYNNLSKYLLSNFMSIGFATITSFIVLEIIYHYYQFLLSNVFLILSGAIGIICLLCLGVKQINPIESNNYLNLITILRI